MKILNLTQHLATVEQEKQGVFEPADKDEIRALLTFNVKPDKEIIHQRARQLAYIAVKNGAYRTMIGGAPYLMGSLERELSKIGVVPVYAFSERRSVEEVDKKTGKVVKKNIFQHIGFVETIKEGWKYEYKELCQILKKATGKERELWWYKILLGDLRIDGYYNSQFLRQNKSPEWVREEDLKEFNRWLHFRRVKSREMPQHTLDWRDFSTSARFAYTTSQYTYLLKRGGPFRKEKEKMLKTQKILSRLKKLKTDKAVAECLTELVSFVDTPFQAVATFWELDAFEDSLFMEVKERVLRAQLKTFDDYHMFVLSAIRKHFRYKNPGSFSPIVYETLDMAQDTARSVSDQLSVVRLKKFCCPEHFDKDAVFSYLKDVYSKIGKHTVEEYIALFISDRLRAERYSEILSGE